MLAFGVCFLLVASLGAEACSAVDGGGSSDWWKTAVFYQIYPRSFKDSNNDGIGDLNGVISKLDHLVDAGITAAWLSPIYKSPQVDHGYDISDFRDVDHIFGTLDDFKELTTQAKAKGIKIILDFVPNHSSDKHEWFAKSEAREDGYENYYVWLDGANNNTEPPNNWISYFHGPAWKYSDIRNQWYLHQFAEGQPDLNYRDPRLVQEMKDVLTYWLDLGVDGFRVDTIPSLVEVADFPDEPLSNDPSSTPNDYGYLLHPYTNDQPETYDMVYQWRALLDEYTKTHGGDARVMMTESWSPIEALFDYYGNGTVDGAHFTFNFFFITQLNRESTAPQIKEVIDRWFEYMPETRTANWVLGNHDQKRVASRYGTERADGLTILQMILPGVGVTYNGEEIAMENGEVTWAEGEDPQACNGVEEDFEKNSRDFERTPYQWDNTTNAGFNEGHKTWLPVSDKYLEVNLKAQNVQGLRSHYNLYKTLVKARKYLDTLKYGTWRTSTFGDNVIAVTRSLAGFRTIIALVNIGGNAETFDLSALGGLPENLFVYIPSVNSQRNKGDSVTTNSVSLSAYEALVLVDQMNNL